MRRSFIVLLVPVLLALAACGSPPGNTAASGARTTAAESPSTSAGVVSTATKAAPSASTVGTPANAASSSAAPSSAAPSSAAPSSAAGQALFVSNGCQACHGEQAKGGIGPTLAGTGLSFTEVLGQVRAPKGTMPPFSAQQVSDAQVRDIYAYLESLGPPTPTPAPTTVPAANAAAAKAPLNVDAVAEAVDKLKVASDYAHDAAKTPASLHTYASQGAAALQAAQKAVQAAITSGGGSTELQGDLKQLQQLLTKVAPHVQAATAATTLAAAEPDTNAMVLASRLDLLPLALELVRLNGETGTITGTVRDTAGKPVAQAFVTIGGGEVHTGLLTGADGTFKAGGIAAFRAVEVKAYKAGDLYVENHAQLPKGGTVNVVLTIPPEGNPPASPTVSNTAASVQADVANLRMTATQKDNRIAPDQIWALSPQAGIAYVLRSSGGNTYSLSPHLSPLKAGSYTWYFFATTHECDMSNVVQQRVTVP